MSGVQLLTPPRSLTSTPDLTNAAMLSVSPSRAAAIRGVSGGPGWQAALSKHVRRIVASFMKEAYSKNSIL
jgi:hypothetical protein